MSKKPFVSADALEVITKTYSTPFHLYNKAEIVRRAKLLQKAFSWNVGFKEYFAVKATPNPYIVKLLAELGCGCDCANATELTLAKACGVTGQDIMLSSNDTTVLDFARAHELGAIINLDAGGDMLATLEEAVGSTMPQVMCARLNPGGVFESQNGIIGNPDDDRKAAFSDICVS